jgi:hypothetical protein
LPKKIVIDGLSQENVANAIGEVRKYQAWILEKESELRSRLASLGATVASIQFSRAIYHGTNDVSVRVDDTGSVAVIYAEGESVAFIEFGAGITYGYGHPLAGELGVGPGTYPEGKGHWDNPNGWWYAHGQHTYGNPPAMAMVAARDAMVADITTIAKGVFGSA